MTPDQKPKDWRSMPKRKRRSGPEKGKKRLINRFLSQMLGLSAVHVGRLFSPHYDPEKVAAYLKKNGYLPIWRAKREKIASR